MLTKRLNQLSHQLKHLRNENMNLKQSLRNATSKAHPQDSEILVSDD
jgi:cell shape-determining protein MreC